MLFILDLFVLLVFLLVVDEFARRSAIAAWIVFLTVPPAFAPFWGRTPGFDTFAHIKLYTILLTACWINTLRFTPVGRGRIGPRPFVVLCAVNILEAVVKDALGARTPQAVGCTAWLVVARRAPRRGLRMLQVRHGRLSVP